MAPAVDPFASTPKNHQQTASSSSAVVVDDDFDGLEDAKEGSSADDDFANISRSGFDEFNAVFDSPAQGGSQQQQQHHQQAGDFAGSSNSAAAAFGESGSFDFASVSASNTGSQQGGGGAKADGHDWDAIFADLDAPQDVNGGGNGNGNGNGTAAAPAAAKGDGEPASDDPMVMNLTSMGYSRADAVAALEKHDYNLELVRCFPPAP
jgi:epidermal growth factor receptor substrate 15